MERAPRPKRSVLSDFLLFPFFVLFSVPLSAGVPPAWRFENSLHSWRLNPNLRVCGFEAGAVCLEITGHDPFMVGPPIAARAAEFPYVVVTMRLETGGGGQIFFSTSTHRGITARNAVSFFGKGDGLFHTYVIHMAGNERWSGVVDRIRLDPPGKPDRKVWIKAIALSKERPKPAWFFAEKGRTPEWKCGKAFSPIGVSEGLFRVGGRDATSSGAYLESPFLVRLIYLKLNPLFFYVQKILVFAKHHH